jgi:hypothetical protein
MILQTCAMDLRLILIPILAFPICLASFLLAGRAWREQRKALAARRWPKTTGRVVASGVRETTVRVRRSTSVASYRMAIRYAPQVRYEYSVGGRRYQGERLHLGATILSSEAGDAARQAGRFPVGLEVAVYYNPADPEDATLKAEVNWGTWALWILALFLLVMAALLAALLLSGPATRM